MWSSFLNFISMGGYGIFIWSSFVLSTVVLIGLFIQSKQLLKMSEAELISLQEIAKNNET
jgi:heme exporter protein CcmD